jgi:tetratricopeptide (TPR) repeat protein
VERSTPSALAEQGKKEYEQANYSAAADFFLQAAREYENANDIVNSAEMKNNQSVALLQGGLAQEALQATEGTEQIFVSAKDLKRQGIAISNRAAALEGLRQWNDAVAEYDRAAAIFEQAGEGDMHSVVRKAAANINIKRGHIHDTQMDIYDSLRLVEKPSFTQRILKFLMRIGFIK